MRRSLSVMLSLCLMVQLVSCSNSSDSTPSEPVTPEGTDTIVIPSVTSVEDTEPSDPADGVCYNSGIVQFDHHVDSFEVARYKDRYLVLAVDWKWDEDRGKSEYNAEGYIVDEDFHLLPKFEVDFGEYVPSEIYALDDDRFLATGGIKEAYRIYDLEGKLVRQCADDHGLYVQDPEMSHINNACRMCAVSDGFVVASGFKAVKFDSNGEYVTEISFNDDEYTALLSVYEQDGKVYVNTVSDDEYVVTRLDFDNGSFEKVMDPVRFGNFASFELEDNTCYSTEIDNNYITKLDMAKGQAVNLVAYSNILQCPASYDASSMNERKRFLDDNHYYVCYNYEGDVAEIVFVYQDAELDLSNRKTITVQGLGVNSDILLRTAAYYYNNMQDGYFIRLEDLSDKISYGSPADTARSMTRLSADYMAGNAPDIFYGNNFNYDYWGRNGITIDMKPYLEANGDFREGDITPSVLKLMEDGSGHIYKTFAGYSLAGYWGRSSDLDKSSYTIAELKAERSLFGNIEASEICYYVLGSNLCSLYQSGGLTPENVKASVQLATDCGIAPVTDPEAVQPVTATSVRSGSAMLYRTHVGNASVFNSLAKDFGGTPVFIGTPSATGTSYMIDPTVCLMSVSASAKEPQACCDFIAYFYSVEMQRKIAASGSVPVNNKVLEDYLGFLADPSVMSADDKELFKNVVDIEDKLIDPYREQIAKADTVELFDWSVYDIIVQEIGSYYDQGKSVDDVADSLYSRLSLYAKENFT